MSVAHHSVSISYGSATQQALLSAPSSMTGLHAAVAAAFDIDIPGRPDAICGLSFRYQDPEGDMIVFDKDAELALALKLCPFNLNIIASRKELHHATQDVDIYEEASRRMRKKHGVPSMTAAKLRKTLPVFKMGPSRLIERNLVPNDVLSKRGANMRAQEIIVEDDSSETAHVQAARVSEARLARPMYRTVNEALSDAGVEIPLNETRPLLKALGILRCRLVGIGIIDRAIDSASGELRQRPYPPGVVDEMYTVAAKSLRDTHGISSMTSSKLRKALALLEFPPKRLRCLLPERMTNGSFSSRADRDGVTALTDTEEEADSDGQSEQEESYCAQDHTQPRNVIDAAFCAANIQLGPGEGLKLLRALHVRTCRLAKLELVKGSDLRQMMRRGNGRHKGRGSRVLRRTTG